MKKLVVLIVLMLFAAGCAVSMNEVLKSRDEGTVKTYPVNQEQACQIAKTVFRWEGADAIEEYRKEGYMLTSSGMSMTSYGAVMGAWIESIDKDNTKVIVVTKRRIPISFTTTLTETTFHERFEQAVGIIKSGKPLPAIAPD